MTTSTLTDTQETPAIKPPSLALLLVRLMITEHQEEIARRKSEVKFLQLIESLIDDK